MPAVFHWRELVIRYNLTIITPTKKKTYKRGQSLKGFLRFHPFSLCAVIWEVGNGKHSNQRAHGPALEMVLNFRV